MGFFSFLKRSEKEADTGNHRSSTKNGGKKTGKNGDKNGGKNSKSKDGSPRQRQPRKRGALFLGVCDMRYATISLNCLHIFAIFLVLICKLFGLVAQDKLVSAGLAIALSSFSIFGAIEYSYFIMYAATFLTLLFTIYYLVDFRLFLFILCCFVSYAQCFFVYEMRLGIMTKERYDAGTEEFITPEGRVVMDSTVGVATEMVESTKAYGNVAAEHTKQATGLVAQQSTRVMEQYVAPTLFGPATKRNNEDNSDDSDGSMVIVKDYVEV